ncbi:isoprenylcysteine carboxyl methyltransferase [Mycobacteroides chelonae]|jgi:protein-S-isoprenylcysteine O-methyltransferase Ste14|uniref:methyltransferase family protein n=1 Tax=Mycobacteroides chelonae TaxID=1774 RepID=UPI0008A89937|nr:isoprenylcysteine carboxylmethyltransferase family protein [Mycobacteroides chelonae]OHU24539.1 isoprenylcysteine carboxyl methyltransferase [Mycobacteroides chelonae]OHU39436.1 isoprenylcysteine carboxyl methyltransferase [Mycobacteroides chelonae]OHU62702.1 isoprenylcysteine carboxyl methyltransferase [Mycobacteroides chelonae]
MAVAALVVYLVFIAAGLGWKSYRQWRATGSTGVRGFHGRPGSREWFAGVGFIAAIIAALFAPILQLAGLIAPLPALDHRSLQVAGIALAATGIVATVGAQQTMGESWRVGVDTRETTTLVSSGVFGWVRNPIFTAMLTFAAGSVLMTPNLLALSGFVLLAASIELQVRVVEEPYLLAAHGKTYRDYGSRVGRFLPGIGRFRAPG